MIARIRVIHVDDEIAHEVSHVDVEGVLLPAGIPHVVRGLGVDGNLASPRQRGGGRVSEMVAVGDRRDGGLGADIGTVDPEHEG